MRVLVISSVYPSTTQPSFGVFVRERVRHLAAHCSLRVVAPVPWFPFNQRFRGSARALTPVMEERDGITVYHPRFFSLPGVGKSLDAALYCASMLPFVARLQRTFPFDVIDAHFAYPDGVAAVLLGKVFKRPVTVTLRGDEARLSHHALRREQMRWALKTARVITVSESLRQLAAQIGIDPRGVRVIPNGVDATLFRPQDQRAARTRLGLPHDRAILLSAGSLIERKGHHRIAEVLPALVAKRPDVLFVVVGGEVPGTGPSYRTVLADLVQRLGLERHVRMVPAQAHADMPMWLAAADLFCLATRWEGWCNALMEALACGLPVVTTRVGGNAEFVRHGQNGLLVPYWDGPGFVDAVQRALESPWDRAAIAADAAAHGWDQVALQVREELEAACRGTRCNDATTAASPASSKV